MFLQHFESEFEQEKESSPTNIIIGLNGPIYFEANYIKHEGFVGLWFWA